MNIEFDPFSLTLLCETYYNGVFPHQEDPQFGMPYQVIILALVKILETRVFDSIDPHVITVETSRSLLTCHIIKGKKIM